MMQLLLHMLPVHWLLDYQHTNQRHWKYRLYFGVMSRVWFQQDQAVGWRFFPHFMAADARVMDGRSIRFPGD